MMDIESTALSSGFTKPEIMLILIRYPGKKFKTQPTSVSSLDAFFNFWKTGFTYRIYGVDGVISIELMID